MSEHLPSVFNRAYEKALRGPTASIALTEAVDAVATALRDEIVAKLEEAAYVAADDQSFAVWLDDALRIVRGGTP